MRQLFITILYATLFFNTVIGISYCEEPVTCMDGYATLTCLKDNFDDLYHNNYEHFWEIIHQYEQKANTCTSLQDTLDFLELADVQQHNAEFTEYLAEYIETLCINDTECMLDALSLGNYETKRSVVEYLKRPIFYTDGEIREHLSVYLDKDKYKDIIEIYKGQE